MDLIEVALERLSIFSFPNATCKRHEEEQQALILEDLCMT